MYNLLTRIPLIVVAGETHLNVVFASAIWEPMKTQT